MPKDPNARRIPGSSLIYNVAAARYFRDKEHGGKGLFLSPERMYAILDADNDATGLRMVAHGERLKEAARAYKAGEIGQDAWIDAVKVWGRRHCAEIKAIHYGNAAVSKGGFHAFTQSDHGRLGARLRVQYAYANNLMIEAAGNPDIVLSLDAARRPFDERVSAYAMAARETYEAFREAEELRAGYDFEVNVEDPAAHHCKPTKRAESCGEQTAKGPVRTGTLVRVGRRACAFKDRCQVKRFKDYGAALAFWQKMTGLEAPAA